MKFIITDAGYAALPRPDHTGTNPTLIKSVALGDGTDPLTAASTALGNEHHRLSTIAGQAVDDNIIHVTIRDESDAAYTVTEFALVLADGTFLGVYSQLDPIIEKAAGSVLLESLDILFTDVDVSTVTFDSMTFSLPPASETVAGVAELADSAETAAGSDDQRIVTPLKLKGVLPVAATTEKAGLVERATSAEASAGTDDQRYISPATLAQVLQDAKTDFIDANNPVETVREFRNDARNPAIILGLPNSTWATLGAGRVTIGAGMADSGTSYSAGNTGGAETHQLTVDEMPSHTHDYQKGHMRLRPSLDGDNLEFVNNTAQTSATGGDAPHNNMQPYVVLYRWVRTA